jgi:hypothetical protein
MDKTHVIFSDFSYLTTGFKYVHFGVHADSLWPVGIKWQYYQVRTLANSPLSVLAHYNCAILAIVRGVPSCAIHTQVFNFLQGTEL